MLIKRLKKIGSINLKKYLNFIEAEPAMEKNGFHLLPQLM